MKKSLALLCAACLCTAGMPVLPAGVSVYAEAEAVLNGMKYKIVNDEITICGYTSALPADLVIPSAIESLPVTAIDAISFSGCKTLTSVIIPDTVVTIGNTAFYAAENLVSVTIPRSVTAFGCDVFTKTPWLAAQQELDPFVAVNGILLDASACAGDVVIPAGIKEIGDNAFCYNKNVTGVTIPSGVTYIGNSSFSNCSALKELNLPDTLTDTGVYTFFGCSSLESVVLPPSLTRINTFLFRECTSLKSVTIPASVKNIGTLPFYESPNVTIYGETGSEAETYAKKNDIAFVSLSPVETTTAVTTAAVSTETTVPSSLRSRDLNGDGQTNIADAVVLLKYIGEDSALPESQIRKIMDADMDLDQDGAVTVRDAAIFLKAL